MELILKWSPGAVAALLLVLVDVLIFTTISKTMQNIHWRMSNFAFTRGEAVRIEEMGCDYLLFRTTINVRSGRRLKQAYVLGVGVIFLAIGFLTDLGIESGLVRVYKEETYDGVVRRAVHGDNPEMFSLEVSPLKFSCISKEGRNNIWHESVVKDNRTICLDGLKAKERKVMLWVEDFESYREYDVPCSTYDTLALAPGTREVVIKKGLSRVISKKGLYQNLHSANWEILLGEFKLTDVFVCLNFTAMNMENKRKTLQKWCISAHMSGKITNLAFLREYKIIPTGRECMVEVFPSVDILFQNSGLFGYESFLKTLEKDPPFRLEVLFRKYFILLQVGKENKVRIFSHKEKVTRVREPALFGVAISVSLMLIVLSISVTLNLREKSGVKIRYDHYNGISSIVGSISREWEQICSEDQQIDIERS